MVHADDLLAFVHGDGVPDRYVVGRQVQLVGAGQGIIWRERICKDRNGLIKQVEDHPLDRPPQRLGQGLDLIPGQARETDQAITH